MHHQTDDVDYYGRAVYIFDEGVLGYVISLGAFASRVEFTVGGIEHQVYMENTDFMFLEDK